MFNIGGGKIRSSSQLAEAAQDGEKRVKSLKNKVRK